MKRAPLIVSLCIYLNLTLLRIALGIVFGSRLSFWIEKVCNFDQCFSNTNMVEYHQYFQYFLHFERTVYFPEIGASVFTGTATTKNLRTKKKENQKFWLRFSQN